VRGRVTSAPGAGGWADPGSRVAGAKTAMGLKLLRKTRRPVSPIAISASIQRGSCPGEPRLAEGILGREEFACASPTVAAPGGDAAKKTVCRSWWRRGGCFRPSQGVDR